MTKGKFEKEAVIIESTKMSGCQDIGLGTSPYDPSYLDAGTGVHN